MIRHLRLRPRLVAFGLALVWIFLLQALFRNEARDRLYFHDWTSEYMMQVVSLGDLRVEPFKSLWYNHIQPPMFDFIRAVIVAFYPGLGPEALMRQVDARLYDLWMFVYAAIAAVVFSWFQKGAGEAAAWTAFVVFLLLPGPIFYATFLDSTLLSAGLILWFHWALWRLARGEARPLELVLVSALLFLTRSVFQWPFLLVLVTSLWLLSIPRARAVRVVLPVASLMALFLLKQYLLFGLTTTSSFGPDSFCKGLSEYCHGTVRVELPRITNRFNAFVLRRAEKLNGDYNYNQEAFLKRSFSQMEEYKAHLRRLTPGRVVEILRTNINHYIRPTSRHSPHVIVDRLPWRAPFDTLLSGWSFLVLLAVCCGAWLRRCLSLPETARGKALRHGFALALPALYIASVTILFESGENMRYRFFIEPTLFVFFALHVSAWVSGAWGRFPRRGLAGAGGETSRTEG